jgi:hypothetical protein
MNTKPPIEAVNALAVTLGPAVSPPCRCRPPRWKTCRLGYDAHDADPGRQPAAGAGRARPDRAGQDRQRQDRGLSLALLANLNPRRFAVQALVLCPTRELAEQVTQELRRLAARRRQHQGADAVRRRTMRPQLASLEHGAHIVVGTPGRIMDHLERGSLNLEALNTLVLDEADRMLDMGFFDDIDRRAKQCPKQRQTLLFSATYPEGIAKLSAAFMREPKEVKLLQQHAAGEDPPAVLRGARGRAAARRVAAAQPLPAGQHAGLLQHQAAVPRPGGSAASAQGFSALELHGDLDQRDRDQVLVRFANRSASVLVATDIAARGLDIAQLEAVINVDITPDPTRTPTASAAPGASMPKAGPSAWPAWTRWARWARSRRPAASAPSGSR